MTPFAGIDSHSCSPLYATGFHAVEADSAIGAAQIYAERLARRRFGGRGYGRIVPLETSTEEIDCEFEARKSARTCRPIVGPGEMSVSA